MKRGSEITLTGADPAGEEFSENLAIHIPRREFGNFIKGLLGQPYEVSRNVFGEFDLTQDVVNQLVHVLNQRVSQQHEAHMVEFSGAIGFAGGLKKRVSDLDAFVNFVDVASNLSCSVSFKITYLIRFPSKDLPEKQQISFYANGFQFPNPKQDSGPVVFEDMTRIEKTSISYRIESTERTWAEDIESLIKARLASAYVSRPRSNLLYRKFKSFVVGAIAISGAVVPIAVEYFRVSDAASRIAAPEILPSTSADEAMAMVAHMLHNYMVIGVNFFHIVYYFAFAIFCFACALTLSDRETFARSYIIYNNVTKEEAERFRDMQNHTPFKFMRDSIAAVVIGLITNLIFLKFSAYMT